MFLGRRPDEPTDRNIQTFYKRLLEAVNRPVFRQGEWTLCARTGWPDNRSFQNLVCWSWANKDERYLIVVNHSDMAAQALVQIGWKDLCGRKWQLQDVLSGAIYERRGDEMLSPGLYVELGPWSYHLFNVAHASETYGEAAVGSGEYTAQPISGAKKGNIQ